MNLSDMNSKQMETARDSSLNPRAVSMKKVKALSG